MTSAGKNQKTKKASSLLPWNISAIFSSQMEKFNTAGLLIQGKQSFIIAKEYF